MTGQAARVLEVLADGYPHTVREIHQRAGTMRLNSRVADLRRKGHQIVCYRRPGVAEATDAYVYQLVGTLGGAEPQDSTADGTGIFGAAPITAPSAPPNVADPDLQAELEEAEQCREQLLDARYRHSHLWSEKAQLQLEIVNGQIDGLLAEAGATFARNSKSANGGTSIEARVMRHPGPRFGEQTGAAA